MSNLIVRVLNDESGATAIEYGLIAALISVAAIAAFDALGTSLISVFTVVSSSIDGAVQAANSGS